MQKEKEALLWGCAKIEFLALIPEIKELLELEYPRTMMYRKLKEQNKITMSYRRFCELINKNFLQNNSRIKNEIAHSDKIHENSKIEQNNANNYPQPIKNEIQLKNEIQQKHNIIEIKTDTEFGKAATSDDLKKLMGG